MLFDLDILPRRLCSHFVPVVDPVVLHDETNALKQLGDMMIKVHFAMTLTFDLEDHACIFTPWLIIM